MMNTRRRGTHRLLPAMAGLVLAFGAARANAGFVTESDGVFGSASVVLDTATGLYWVKPVETVGLSYSTVQSEIAGGLTGHFAYASSAQVHTLFADAGITDFTNDFSSGSYAGANTVVSAFGQTSGGAVSLNSNGGSYAEVDGVYAGNYDAFTIAYRLSAAGTLGCAGTTCAETDISSSSLGAAAGNAYGSWLVASSLNAGSAPPVPLPASGWLLLSGVGALGLMGRRSARSRAPEFGSPRDNCNASR